MITLESWRAQIGGYNSIKTRPCRGSSLAPAAALLLTQGLKLRMILSSMVLAVLLVIGGVEKNPGPPKRTKGQQETSDLLYLGEDYNSDDVFSTDLFRVPTTMSITKLLPVPKPKNKGRSKKDLRFFVVHQDSLSLVLHQRMLNQMQL